MAVSYTADLAADPTRAAFRRAATLMPRSRIEDALRLAAFVPFSALCTVGLVLPSLLLLPFYLFRGPAAEKDVSNRQDGSLTAIKALNGRAVVARCGFNPDVLSPRLMDELSLFGPGAIGYIYTQAYVQSLTLGFALGRRFYTEEVFRPLLGKNMRFSEFTYLQMRTCWLDDVVTRFVRERGDKLSQLVILGAGYDTRCIRLDLPPNIRCFEVDAPGTQKAKREALRKAGIDAPRTNYVACDFTRQDWSTVLAVAGFDMDLPTCFVWEGVTMYLPQRAVEQTLKQVSKLAPGCIIAFDCMDKAWVDSPAMSTITRRAGEAWRFGLTRGDETRFVQSLGLRCLDNLRADELLRRYLPVKANGESLGACLDFGAFVLAGP